MLRCASTLLGLLAVNLTAQTECPPVNVLTARTANLKPAFNSHIDLVRQTDGSYTGFEFADAQPFRQLSVVPHFERQFLACLPTPPRAPMGPGIVSSATVPVVSQQVVTTLPTGKIFVAGITFANNSSAVLFQTFDSQHNLLSRTIFTSPVPSPVPGSENFQLLSLTDLNQDGKLDLIAFFTTPVVESRIYGGVWVFPGNGDGTFQSGRRQILTSGISGFPPAIGAVGDLNGDGKPDLVLAVANQKVIGALGNGDYTFSPRELSLPSSASVFTGSGSILVADLNGDSYGDLISVQQSGSAVSSLAIAFGDGQGGFKPGATYPVTTNFSSAGFLALGDVNGDRIPDIVTAGGTILFGDGKGGFPARRDYVVSQAASVMIIDFNGDGIMDIVFGAGNADYIPATPQLTVLLGRGGGSFLGAPVSASDVIANTDARFATADFDGDGLADLVVATTSATALHLITLQGQGDGRFLPVNPGFSQTISHAPGFGPVSAIAADFNHDGKPDVAVLLTVYPDSSEVRIFPGRGDGTFGPSFILVMPDSDINYISAPDVNGDGIPDLAATSLGSTFIWLGKGDGTFSSPVFSLKGNSPVIGFGDFNGDGKPDLVAIDSQAASMNILLGAGDGTFTRTITSDLPGPAASFPQQHQAPRCGGLRWRWPPGHRSWGSGDCEWVSRQSHSRCNVRKR